MNNSYIKRTKKVRGERERERETTKENRQSKIEFLIEANNHLWKSFETTLHSSFLADFRVKLFIMYIT